MTDSMHIESNSVARRSSCKSPDYRQLTSVDWVVLDFTDGIKSFEELQTLLPVRRNEIEGAFFHLRELGLLTWDDGNSSRARRSTASNRGISSMGKSSASSLEQTGGLRASLGRSSISLEMASSSYSDEVCAQYLPPKLFSEFRRFKPSLTNGSLDIPVERQAFAEFIYENLSTMSHYDLLGLTEGQCDKAAIKQAYLLRTKQFHPDRYFRKNLGPFEPRIAAIFKAITSAFTTLQSGR